MSAAEATQNAEVLAGVVLAQAAAPGTPVYYGPRLSSINPRTGLVLAFGAIDNLGKGAAAQAVQNANVMTGQPETAGLLGLPLLF